jgi:hypothetical protein
MVGLRSSMMLVCFLRCRRLGLFLPFILALSSASRRCVARRAALAASSSARRCATTSAGSFRTLPHIHVRVPGPVTVLGRGRSIRPISGDSCNSPKQRLLVRGKPRLAATHLPTVSGSSTMVSGCSLSSSATTSACWRCLAVWNGLATKVSKLGSPAPAGRARTPGQDSAHRTARTQGLCIVGKAWQHRQERHSLRCSPGTRMVLRPAECPMPSTSSKGQNAKERSAPSARLCDR